MFFWVCLGVYLVVLAVMMGSAMRRGSPQRPVSLQRGRWHLGSGGWEPSWPVQWW